MTALFLIAGIIVIAAFRYKGEIQEGYGAVVRSTGPIRSKVVPMPPAYREILTKYFPYYNRLTVNDKSRFEQKLCYIIYSKVFIPRNFDGVTDEMKVLIAATAVQLTFGLNGVYLSHFRRILIYPNDYYLNT